MKCQKCDKPATFHITDLVDGKPNELHLCEDCAHKFLAPAVEEAGEAMPPIAGILAQHLAVGETAEQLARLDEVTCPVCGITFLEFRKQGRLGCPHDYVGFASELEPLLLNIHGETRHVGKVPKRGANNAEQQTRLIVLRRQMKEAIASEEYERASKLRDEIRKIESARVEAGGEPKA
jgi:protein arginine kinase activator